MDLEKYLKDKARIVNRELFRLSAGRTLIDTAMRYSLMAGGKRLRPVLVICAAEMFGAKLKDILPAACALEYVHTYSLIHDDLPAMDNDDLRRGKPTSHRKFGEAAAILAGDALLTEAFGILARCAHKGNIKPKNVLRALEILVSGAGKSGMIDGQVRDTLEGGKWRNRSKKSVIASLEKIHMNKTAALIRASLTIGAVLADAKDAHIRKLDNYGKYIGLAFQITDDILDIKGDKALLGKKGSDRKNRKLTYPAIFGTERSEEMSKKLIAKANVEISTFGSKAKVLSAIAGYITSRSH